MSKPFGIAAVQMSVVPWDAPATVEKMADVTQQIARSFPWVQMIVFHELCVAGLVQFVAEPSPGAWRRSAEVIPGGPLSTRLCEIARKTRKWLIPGSMYELDGDKLYNTSLAISPEGEIVAKYRKMFPWLPLEAGTAFGDEFVVFDVPDVGRFGLSICYDMWFPETIRNLVWMGAEVIIHPTMTPTSDRELELVLSRANAIFNQCYFVDVNGIGPWGGGRSLIVDPNGRVLQEAGQHETIMTEIIDLELVRQTREYGTIGLAQTLKQWRDTPVQYPAYRDGIGQGELFKTLGPLRFFRKLES